MKSEWDRIEAWLAENAPNMLDNLQPGATDELIHQAESFMGIELPEDVKAHYRIHNGERTEVDGGLLEGFWWLPLEEVMVHWKFWKGILDEETEEIEGEPHGPIKTNWWNLKWIPITTNNAGDYYCLDLDPAPGGEMGQIISAWHEGAVRYLVTNSFQSWLEILADDLESGKYSYCEEYRLVREDDE